MVLWQLSQIIRTDAFHVRCYYFSFNFPSQFSIPWCNSFSPRSFFHTKRMYFGDLVPLTMLSFSALNSRGNMWMYVVHHFRFESHSRPLWWCKILLISFYIVVVVSKFNWMASFDTIWITFCSTVISHQINITFFVWEVLGGRILNWKCSFPLWRMEINVLMCPICKSFLP